MHPGVDLHVDERRRLLLEWYDTEARDLPWRRETTLYGTWIAEVMLQQTTVRAVMPRWPAFLARFPDVTTLAAAEESAVLAAWSGLGYYRRARLLHRAARQLSDHHDGRLPTSHDQWRALPGVGDYAAGAIASIGLGLPVAAVDANVRRVMTRWHCADSTEASGLKPASIGELARAHVVAARPGDWNQAVMDLGAGPCRAGEPNCRICPVRATCAAGRAGTAAMVPPPRSPVEVQPVLLSCLVLRGAERALLLPVAKAVVASVQGLGRPRRRDLAGLFTGMLALPSTPWYAAVAASGAATEPLVATWRLWLASLGAGTLPVSVAGTFRHAITVYRLRVVVMVVDWPEPLEIPTIAGAVWARLPALDQPLATPARRALDLAGKCAYPRLDNDL